MKQLFALLLILPLLLMAVPASAEYQIGDHVEDFTLPDSDDNMVNLYDYADRIVVMAWWSPG